MEVNYEGGNTGSIFLSNIDFQQFLDDGFFNPLKWMKYTELSRRVLSRKIFNAVSGNNSMFYNDKSLYLVQQHAEFFPELVKYLLDIKSSKNNVVVNSLKIVLSLVCIKNTSAISTTKVYDEATGITLTVCTTVLVLMDFNTKLPTPFPLSVKNFVANESDDTIHSSKRILTSLPVDIEVFTWSRRITMLDTDLNGHTNNVAFVSLSFDCLGSALASRPKYPVALKCPLHDNILQKQSLVIMKEIKQGQTVTVKMWQVSKEFRFMLYVNDLKAAFVSLEFFHD